MEKVAPWKYNFLHSAQFRTFWELIPEAVICSNEEGEIILTNTVAQQLFQYLEDEFLQHKIEGLVPPNIRAIHPKLRADFLSLLNQGLWAEEV